jgi:hypothetical protein
MLSQKIVIPAELALLESILSFEILVRSNSILGSNPI